MAKTRSHAGPTQVPKRGISQQQEVVPASDALSAFGPNKTVRLDKKDFVQVDGCEAAAYIAYTCAENIFIYPISPATSMGEYCDAWSQAGVKNFQGKDVAVRMMQSEAGAAGALHGAVTAGVMSTTFTSSQGLLLMIPNMYLIAGELMPSVIHVTARAISKHGLSIFNDHSDVMATRQTGFAMLCSANVQEVGDFALVSHIATLTSRVPFLHFFDGWRTSSQVEKIHKIPVEQIAEVYPAELLDVNLRSHALNPNTPFSRGLGYRPDIFFQAGAAAKPFFDACPDHVIEAFARVEAITGRHYRPYMYHGAPDADRLCVLMGSAAQTVEESVDYLNKLGGKVGVLNVHLYRPWSAKHFLSEVPKTVKRVAILDKTDEGGAHGNPLFLDVTATFAESPEFAIEAFTGGVYGIGGKGFLPNMAKAVFDNLHLPLDKLQRRYDIGIVDDVTGRSLPIGPNIQALSPDITQCLFYGLGKDGTVGANRQAIKSLGDQTDMKVQGYFVFDAHKGEGLTISHLRFGPTPIKAQYEISSDADYVAIHHLSYLHRLAENFMGPIKEGGVLLLNVPWVTPEALDKNLSPKLKKLIAEKKVKLWAIDARSIAAAVGLRQRINNIMQACFYKLSGVLPEEQALQVLKNDIASLYTSKGPKVLKMNYDGVDAALEAVTEIHYPESWLGATEAPVASDAAEVPAFVKNIQEKLAQELGDQLPVSAFPPGGIFPNGTCAYEKRGLAGTVPTWVPENCTQCNYCAMVCPHGVIRPFLLNRGELKGAPESLETVRAKGTPMNYSILVSTDDCTGCEVCVESCPDDALFMEDMQAVKGRGLGDAWEYAVAEVTKKRNPSGRDTVKGSQFEQPLLEFSGACSGCGETAYVKLLTQLFGERMTVANSSGCSSVWGGIAGYSPFSTTPEGQGPAWGRSLFEDSAEYGFGMRLAVDKRRENLGVDVKTLLAGDVGASPELCSLLEKWYKVKMDPDQCHEMYPALKDALAAEEGDHPVLARIQANADMLTTQSVWIVGGDGWAYDIGFGGLDHILAEGENVNIVVLDTEMYSNTGGQVSKASQLASSVKYQLAGKDRPKKNLGKVAMQYGHVYVAQVSLGADYGQTVRALKEAESYDGPSLLLCLTPCVDWGYDIKDLSLVQEEAVNSGYWPLYRYDPRKGDAAFQLDSKRIKSDVINFLNKQNRFAKLLREDPERGEMLQGRVSAHIHGLHEEYLRMGMSDPDLLDHLKKQYGEDVGGEKHTILYASETGTAQFCSEMFEYELKRRGLRTQVVAMDDYSLEDLPNEENLYLIAATCGQGEYPGNSKAFMKALAESQETLENVSFSVFGLGDDSYVHFNKAAVDVREDLLRLGAKEVAHMGMGNDKDDDKWETAFDVWAPEVFAGKSMPQPPDELMPSVYNVNVLKGVDAPTDQWTPPNTQLIPMTMNRLESGEGYDRDIRHYEFDIANRGLDYSLGDCLAVYPHNQPHLVHKFMDDLKMPTDTVFDIQRADAGKSAYWERMKADQVFEQVLDVFGKPSKRFYEFLGIIAQDPSEKAQLKHMLTKEGEADLRVLTDETVTYADLLERFPSCQMTTENMLEFIPNIKPRLYSIASAQEQMGDCLQLCIIADDWSSPSGVYRHGTSTAYLKGLQPDSRDTFIAGNIVAGGVHIPPHHRDPFIMVALGTGIAPLRAMMQERDVFQKRGEEVGPMALYFGVRNSSNEYTYGKEELEPYHDGGNGLLTHLRPAFSRDQAAKVYVQDKIKEDQEMLVDWFMNKNGHLYLCGPAGRVPSAVRAQLAVAFQELGGMSATEADEYLTSL